MKSLNELYFLSSISNELNEIKSHFCNDRDFEAGVGLGQLIVTINYRTEFILDKETDEDEEIQGEEQCEAKFKKIRAEKNQNIIEFYERTLLAERYEKEMRDFLRDAILGGYISQSVMQRAISLCNRVV